MKKLIYITIITALLPETIPSINFGWFHLSLFRFSFILMSLGYFIDLFKNRDIWSETKQWTKQSYSVIFMIVWFLFAMISAIWVQDYFSWLKSIYFLSLGTISTLVFTKYLKDIKDIINISRLLTPVILIHNLLGWSEIITGNYLFLAKDRFERYIRYKHPVSIFGNTNDFAVFLMFAFFISLINFLYAKDQREKYLNIALMISATGLIYYTGSRSTILGLAMALYAAFYLKKRQTTTKYTKIGLLLLLPLGLIFYLAFPEIINQYKAYYSQLANGINSLTIRWNLLKNGWMFILKTYGLGVGSGNVEVWMKNYPIYETGKILKLHNWWMEILVAYGAGIFIMYIIFYFKLIKDMAKTALYSQDTNMKIVSFGMFLTLIAFIAGSFSPSSNLKISWMWIFMSIIVTAQQITTARKRELKSVK